jgi:hypothetical protein
MRPWVCICSLRYPACKTHAPYCHLGPARLNHIFPHYLINGTVYRNNQDYMWRQWWPWLSGCVLLTHSLTPQHYARRMLTVAWCTDRNSAVGLNTAKFIIPTTKTEAVFISETGNHLPNYSKLSTQYAYPLFSETLFLYGAIFLYPCQWLVPFQIKINYGFVNPLYLMLTVDTTVGSRQRTTNRTQQKREKIR